MPLEWKQLPKGDRVHYFTAPSVENIADYLCDIFEPGCDSDGNYDIPMGWVFASATIRRDTHGERYFLRVVIETQDKRHSRKAARRGLQPKKNP